MFTDFDKELLNLRKKTGKFWRADLHIHTWEDDNWGRLGNKEGCATELIEADIETSLEGLKNAARSKQPRLNLLGVVDHNSYANSCKLASTPETCLVIIPGIELNIPIQDTYAPDYCHVLVYLPEGSDDRVFRNLLQKHPLRKIESNQVISATLSELTNFVRENSGICIIAHAFSDRGHLRTSITGSAKAGQVLDNDIEEVMKEHGNQIIDYYRDMGIDAIEVHKAEHVKFFTDRNGKLKIPVVMGSDSRNWADIGLESSSFYIKTHKIGLEAVKRAFIDPDVRILLPPREPEYNYDRIKGIMISSSFWGNSTAYFSDNLNCLIGIRGSGKSAVLDSIRYALDFPESEQKELNDAYRGRLKHTLKNAHITIKIEKADGGEVYLKRAFNEGSTNDYFIKGTAGYEITNKALVSLTGPRYLDTILL